MNLSGKTVCITGTLSRPRKAVVRKLNEQGAKWSRHITHGADLLIAGSDPGAKLDIALGYGVPVYTESQITEAL